MLPAAADRDADRAALAVTGCHGPGCYAAQPGGEGWPEPGLLYAACQRVPRPGGILAVITAGPPTRTVKPPTCPATWGRARAAGLIYTQHIVLVHAAIRDSQLDPHSAAVAVGVPGGWRIHTDLLIFVQPGGPL